MGRVFGYARVSTLDQNLDRQLDMLNERGAEVIFTEKISGMKRSRPELNALLAQLNQGDTVVVESLSWLGRSTKDLIELMEQFQQRGVHLVSLKESINTSTASGKLLFSIMNSLRQMSVQRALIRAMRILSYTMTATLTTFRKRWRNCRLPTKNG